MNYRSLQFFLLMIIAMTNTAWGATLMWNANLESDLAGYRVYQCSQTPCTKTSGTASPLATLGKVTSFNIGTPAVTTHYFITAYDFANNESSGSSSVTFTAAASPLPLPPPSTATVNLAVVGNPATGPWGVTATTSSTQDVMADVRLDGVKQYTENYAPYDFIQKLYGTGSHVVEFVFYLQNTSIEIGRKSITVIEGSPPATVNLAVIGNPATGPWGVTATTSSTQDVMADVRLDGVKQYTENYAPYDFFQNLYGAGSHVVEFVFYLQNTAIEIGRKSIIVKEGSPVRSPAAETVNLAVVGNPATGPWGVTATTTSTQDVMADVRLDGVKQYTENYAPYDFFQNLYGAGSHTVEFVFYLQNTAIEIGRKSIIVKEGP